MKGPVQPGRHNRPNELLAARERYEAHPTRKNRRRVQLAERRDAVRA
jgi:hypothetical protein